MNLTKEKVFGESLENGYKIQVHIKECAGLKIPPHVKCPNMLEYAFNMPNPIPDLQWNDKGIRATLSFGQQQFKTFVPWDSITAMRIIERGEQVIVIWPGETKNLSHDEPPKSPKPTLSIVR